MIAIAAATVIRILLTGGPGGGKSSFFSWLQTHGRGPIDACLEQVPGSVIGFFPEAATTMMEQNGPLPLKFREADLLTVFARHQHVMEESSLAFLSLGDPARIVQICDRGVADCALFSSSETAMETIWADMGLSRSLSRSRYDLVLHFQPPLLAEQYDDGPDSNNEFRFHDHSDSLRADGKCAAFCAAFWEEHRQYVCLPFTTHAEGKFKVALQHLLTALGF